MTEPKYMFEKALDKGARIVHVLQHKPLKGMFKDIKYLSVGEGYRFYEGLKFEDNDGNKRIISDYDTCFMRIQ